MVKEEPEYALYVGTAMFKVIEPWALMKSHHKNYWMRLKKSFRSSPLKAVQSIKAMAEGRSKVFIALGGNFAAATPDTEVTTKALSSCDLTVNIATKLNRTHVTPGKTSLILPCLGRTDVDMQKAGAQKVTVEDSFSMVHASGGVINSDTANMRSEPAIIAGIANAVLGQDPVDWQDLVTDYGKIRQHIARTIPGFENFNVRLKEPGGFYLGNSAPSVNGKLLVEKHSSSLIR